MIQPTLNIESLELNVDRVLRGIDDFIDQDAEEDLRYFFVSDHLGSSSFITDVGGDAVQHLQYMPPDSYRDGEDYIYQRNSSWNVPYTFSGKEKDSETGYSYFGARYYDSDLSVWLSVDPMSDRLPFISPYSYCYNHPINYKDPDGKFPWLTGAIGAVVSVGIGAISAAINDEEYSFKEGLKDAAIGFAIGSGAALLAPALGITAASSVGAKVAYGAGYGLTTSMMVNSGEQFYNLITDKQDEWNNTAFVLSGTVGLFTGAASGIMGAGAQKFMNKIGDKYFKDLTKHELSRYIKIQTKYLNHKIEATTGGKVKQRQLQREVAKQVENWKDLRTTEIDFIKLSTVKVTESGTTVTATVGGNEVGKEVTKDK